MVRDEQTDVILRALSRLLGWIYFLAWSASFYPQPYLNWKRRSTHGLAIDYPTLNVLGFLCYTISTSCFLYSPVIRAQYASRHPAAPEPTVRFNDLAFGGHALVLVIVTYSQFFASLWGFTISSRQRTSKPIAGIVLGSAIAIIIMCILVVLDLGKATSNTNHWTWIDVIYGVGYVKLIATLVKYMPQAWVNYKRKSTRGWSIGQILFDLTGGIFSLLQLIIDASFQDDWSGITGNPVKLGLANISMFFDIIFITQHYILYKDSDSSATRNADADSETPLLNE